MATLSLPIFPLAVVLFPGAPQLLHIFEPRYRQLLADCLAGDHRFGISFVEREMATDARPPVGHVGCCAVVKTTSQLPDGRSNVLTEGSDRYTIARYLETDRLYLLAEVETFDDEEATEVDIGELAERVGTRFVRFAETMHALNDRGMDPLDLPSDPKALSFQVAAGVNIDPSRQHALLELRSTYQRLEQLDRLLRHLNRELEQRITVHARARGNGKGDAHPDLAAEA